MKAAAMQVLDIWGFHDMVVFCKPAPLPSLSSPDCLTSVMATMGYEALLGLTQDKIPNKMLTDAS